MSRETERVLRQHYPSVVCASVSSLGHGDHAPSQDHWRHPMYRPPAPKGERHGGGLSTARSVVDVVGGNCAIVQCILGGGNEASLAKEFYGFTRSGGGATAGRVVESQRTHGRRCRRASMGPTHLSTTQRRPCFNLHCGFLRLENR